MMIFNQVTCFKNKKKLQNGFRAEKVHNRFVRNFNLLPFLIRILLSDHLQFRNNSRNLKMWKAIRQTSVFSSLKWPRGWREAVATVVPTFVLSLVSSKSWEENRVPLRATVSFGSGPDCDGLEVSDSALSCSSRDKTIPSPFSSEESRVCRREEAQSKRVFVCVCICEWGTDPHSQCGNLFKKRQVAATLSEA